MQFCFGKRAALAIALCLGVATPVLAAEGRAPDLYRKITDEQAEEADQFALNNAIATVFHEAGHMLISEFKLPVLGREEDAADSLATILLLEGEDEDMNSIAEDFANVWFLNAGLEDNDDLPFWDSHGLSEQRAYNVVCLMLGKNEERFKDFAASIDFPDYRREECKTEYGEMLESWNKLLEPHSAKENDKIDFKIRYLPTKDPKLVYFRNMAKDAEVLETVVATFTGVYKLKDGIKLTARACGEANAFWNADDREMTLCYEDLEQSARLDAQWYIDNPDDQAGGIDETASDDDKRSDNKRSDDKRSDDLRSDDKRSDDNRRK